MNKLKANSVAHAQTVEIPEPLHIHPSVSPLAAELLLKTVEELMVRPENYNQQKSSQAIARCAGVLHDNSSRPASCGTACCILGWMRIFAALEPLGCGGVEREFKAVGLTDQQGLKLFDSCRWPHGMRPDVNWDDEIPASAGIARIEHFLTTGE